MIGLFKRTFQTIYLDEIHFFLYVCVYIYGVIYTGNIYMVLIMRQAMLMRLRKTLDN